MTHATDLADLRVTHDHARSRFEAEVDGQTAYLAYRQADERTVDFRHTFVPPVLRNRHIGRRLVRHAVAWAEGHGFAVIPSCGFVRRVIEEDW